MPRTVFLFAHPDDEFAVFAEIERARREGRAPWCVYLTDGAYRGVTAAQREAESLDVLGRMGIGREDVAFLGRELGVGDGALPSHAARAAEAVKDRVSTLSRPLRWIVPAWEGGHQDHDTTHAIALAVAGSLGGVDEVRQFPLYHGRGLPGPMFHTLAPLPANGSVEESPIAVGDRLRYLAYCTRYPSQWRTWVGLLPMVALRYLTSGTQKLQRAQLPRVRERPHEGPLLYERRGFASYRDVAAAVRALGLDV